MIAEFKLPELGENIASGDIVNILVHEGEEITANQGVVELETEKAVVEIPCPHAGKVVKLQVRKGDTVKVGQVVLTLEVEAESPERPPPAAAESVAAKISPTATRPHPNPPPARERGSCPLVPPCGGWRGNWASIWGSPRQRPPRTHHHGRCSSGGLRRRPTGRLAGSPAVACGFAIARRAGQDAWGPVRRERMSRIRRTIAERMARVGQHHPARDQLR